MTADWDRKYLGALETGAAAIVLAENQHLLPSSGSALDIACGLGANAMLLARNGLETYSWDSSQVAIDLLQDFSRNAKVHIRTSVRDVILNPPDPDCWDVIVVSQFLDRGLCQHISAALRPGGLVFYQTFTRCRVSEGGPSDAMFLLKENELLQLFSNLIVRLYREEGNSGNTLKGFRNKAYLIAQKPVN